MELSDAVSHMHSGPLTKSSGSAEAVGITVVVCTRDRVDMLKVALASILALDYANYAVIVVDNAARTDETRNYVTGLGDPRVRLVVEPRPGLSRARNAGLSAATTEIVAFTDDDVLVDRHWLQGIADGFGRAPTAACVSGIVPSGEIRTPAQAYFDQRVGWASSCNPALYELDSPPAGVPLFPFQVGIYGTGANFAVRREVVFALGGFDEALGVGSPTAGGEDLDMFFRILLGGWSLAYEPSAIVWHRHRADNDALAVQARGYGLGLGAWLTKIALDRRTALLALRTLVRNARTAGRLGYRMAKVANPPAALVSLVPGGVGKLELTSILRGPLAYRAARREGRRASPLMGGCHEPAVVDG
ncbi:glycosyltransferase [Mycobacterium sp. NPDC006124]|uniref:glycosyltransferase family 2 protein n=1 Tax=Mycobacterium sp. NPDC006124 TaxID=3156729 RepID=UPI0033BE309D